MPDPAEDAPLISAAKLDQLVDTFDWDAWNTKILAAIKPHYEAIAREQGQREADQHDLTFDPKDPFVDRWFTSYLGERITQIDETTRGRIRNELQAALADGKGDNATELASRLRSTVADAYVLSPARALTIARTEAAYGYGHGAGLAYKQNGVEHVEISDGDGDEECADADGQIWTVDEYLSEVIAHPNCVRSAAPADEDADDKE